MTSRPPTGFRPVPRACGVHLPGIREPGDVGSGDITREAPGSRSAEGGVVETHARYQAQSR